ncbi:MAG: hypothetical protein Ct9H300mP20_18690 [Gammaproteobacteria bacterium]|nr:MAG: hypothetical protein Ct9H300mP20_18690 [Gammaproteobacteria bacterium]
MQPKTPSNPGRRKFLIAATSIVGTGRYWSSYSFVAAFNPSEQAKAAGAPSKADISKLRAGKMMLVKWRGIPI